MAQTVLEFRGVSKFFGPVCALERVSFTIEAGELFTLLGPSGCGKTTTLRLVAGLEEPDEGEIIVIGKPVASPERGVFVAPEKRQMGMVFQSYAIWPHLSVFENVAFPLRVRGESAAVIKKGVCEALRIVGLEGLESRGATELSGGQQQRVALARSLVYAPAILLLDEPLSNLDAKLREQMRFEIRALQKKLRLTILYVTHDQAEAMTLSDRMAVVQRGRFEQIGTPAEVYESPATSFVSEFLGRTVIFRGVVIKNPSGCWFEVASGGGRLLLEKERGNGFTGGESVRLFVRPEDIEILPAGELSPIQIPAKVEEVSYLGDHFEYQLRVSDMTLVLPASKRQRYAVGSHVDLRLDPRKFQIDRL
jgi:iron(III) transport system ATP-binding protein